MSNKEEKKIYEMNNQKYTVIIRTIENSKSLDSLYEAFSKYAFNKLSTKI